MRHIILLISFLLCCWQANGQDYLKVASTCFEKGDYECAKKHYILFQMLDGRDMSAQIRKADECLRTLNLADDYFKEKEYEKALERYLSVLDCNPKDTYAQKQYFDCKKILDSIVTTITVSPRELLFTSSGGTEYIIIETNADTYDIISLPDWCSVVSHNSDGISIKCDAWNENSPREGYCSVIANDLIETVFIVQSAAPALLPSPQEEEKVISENTNLADWAMEDYLPDNLLITMNMQKKTNQPLVAGGIGIAAIGIAASILTAKPFIEKDNGKIREGKKYNLIYAASGIALGGFCIGKGIKKKKANVQSNITNPSIIPSSLPAFQNTHSQLQVISYGNEVGLRLTF